MSVAPPSVETRLAGAQRVAIEARGSGRKAFRLVRKAPSLARKPRNLVRKAFCLARDDEVLRGRSTGLRTQADPPLP